MMVQSNEQSFHLGQVNFFFISRTMEKSDPLQAYRSFYVCVLVETVKGEMKTSHPVEDHHILLQNLPLLTDGMKQWHVAQRCCQ